MGSIITNMTSDFGDWLTQVSVLSDFGGWLAQVPVLSDFGYWLAQVSVLRDVVESFMMNHIFGVMFIGTIVCITLAKLHNMSKENEEDILEGYEVDGKIKTFKRNCQALKMVEVLHFNLNIRGYRAMILEKYTPNIIHTRMQSTVNFLAEMKARNMNYVLKMKEMEFPLIREIIEEEAIPDEVEVGDAVALIMLLSANLGLYSRDLQYGQSIYPTSVGKRIEEVKQMIEPLAEQIRLVLEVDDNNASKNMMNMLRKGKLMLLLNELEQLENLMGERTQEFMNLLRRRPTPAQAQQAFQRPPNPQAQAGPSNRRAGAGRANARARAARANAPAHAERVNAPDRRASGNP